MQFSADFIKKLNKKMRRSANFADLRRSVPKKFSRCILTLAVMPGPSEPKLHEINHYLHPIVNQLSRLWDGYDIKMHEYNNGNFVREAIIGCSSDVPAS